MAYHRMFGNAFRHLYPKTRRKAILFLAVIGIIIFVGKKYNVVPLHNDMSIEVQDLTRMTGDIPFNIDDNAAHTTSKSKVSPTINEKTFTYVNPYMFDNDITKRGKSIDEPINKILDGTISLLESTTPSVLIFSQYEKLTLQDKLKETLNSFKVNFDTVVWNRPEDNLLVFPRLEDRYGNPRYQAFIFTSHHIYDQFDIYSKDILKKYCTRSNVGIIIFVDPKTDSSYKMISLPVEVHSGNNIILKKMHVLNSKLLKITKHNNVLNKEAMHGNKHAVFVANNLSSFEVIAYVEGVNESKTKYDSKMFELNKSSTGEPFKKAASILHDKGSHDGINKILFGSTLATSFLHQLIFLDVLSHISNGSIGYGQNRYMQIDVDDVFVGSTGKKLLPDDVKALIEAQDYFANQIPGFYYNLGFCGHFFGLSNNSLEREADHLLALNSNKFRWFSHTYRHVKPHILTKDEIVRDLRKNLRFAQEYNLSVDYTYSVAPHHSGTYPTHDALYEAWKEVLGIQVTSTEGYPHLYPAWKRRGFLYKDIVSLPRQTCGLFTKTLNLSTYPKGPNALYESANGGELFWTIVNNPVSIFMTHAPNYSYKERLAISHFKNVTGFIKKWTNLKLLGDTPLNLANKYFETFPKQLEPQWRDPCIDERHRKIWNMTDLYCSGDENGNYHSVKLPDFIILGPQKTGTTALHSFLALHPNIKKSKFTRTAFEEIQFFNRNNYVKGINWYMDFFPDPPKESNTLYFDKSANYFDSLKTPLRAFNLVPNAKLIAISMDPRNRSYSWYQHMYSKNDSIALNHSFWEVINSQNKTDDIKFFMLQQRCLFPGLYAEALERWLQYYRPEKIHIVDEFELRYKPHLAMKKVADFLQLPPFPFNERIRYSEAKGFYCAVSSSRHFDCLGKGKGRPYPKMGQKEYQFLTDYYRIPNVRFADLLNKLHKPLPRWLKKETPTQDGEVTKTDGK